MFEVHSRFQDEGIEVFAKLKMFSKEGVSEKTAVEQHFKEIVSVIVIEYDSLSVSSWIITDSVDRSSPNLDEFNDISCQLS